MEISKNAWFAKKITDYWDPLQGAIEKHAERLSALSPDERTAALKDIRACVTEHARVLPDEWLVQVAFVAADDLYKTIAGLARWDECFPDYLAASAATFCSRLSDRGYVIQYVADNTFELTEVGMSGPLDYYPVWFGSAGFAYICPQKAALLLMRADRRQEGEYFELLPKYITEARDVAAKAVRKCQEERRHFFFLDTDSTEGSLSTAMSQLGADGVVGIFRNEAPVAGSKCQVSYPKANLSRARRPK